MKKQTANAIDLGALQNEVVLAERDAKAKAKACDNAQTANDNAKARLVAARETLQAGSRAVLAK